MKKKKRNSVAQTVLCIRAETILFPTRPKRTERESESVHKSGPFLLEGVIMGRRSLKTVLAVGHNGEKIGKSQSRHCALSPE